MEYAPPTCNLCMQWARAIQHGHHSEFWTLFNSESVTRSTLNTKEGTDVTSMALGDLLHRREGGGEREGGERGEGLACIENLFLSMLLSCSCPLSPSPQHIPAVTSISSLCIWTSLDTLTFFPVLVLTMLSPRRRLPWYTRTYVNCPNLPA